MTKDEYIGRYLDRKMKGVSMPLGLAYYNLIYNLTDKAERQWERMVDKILKQASCQT